jgi:transposase
MEAAKRGLKKGLHTYRRLVMLFMDETILTSNPPLRAKWVHKGSQAVVPIVGNHTRRILYGTMSLRGGLLIHDTQECNQDEFQIHLCMIRSLWRGWNIVLFLDKASSHTADDSVDLAEDLGIALRWLPTACPKLNPMDHLWRHIKGDVLANSASKSIDECVSQVYEYLQAISSAGWMRKSGLFSETFWLREYCRLTRNV